MGETASLGYPGLNACTLASDVNSSYLANTGHIPTFAPTSGPTTGLMMLLSTLQYQAPYMNPTYSNAASQAGKAAFVESGGQAFQDKTVGMTTREGIDFAHSIGINDTEMGIVGFTAKTLRSRQVNFKGPSIGPVKSNLTGTENSGSIGFKYEW